MASKNVYKHYARDTRAQLIADSINDLQQREIGWARAEHMLVYRDTNDTFHNFGEATELDSRSYSSLAQAVSSIGITAATLVVTQDEIVTDDLVIPDNIFLRVTGSGTINVLTGKTITVGPFEAPPTRNVFIGAGSVVWRAASNFRVLQQWATGSDDVKHDTGDSWLTLGKRLTLGTSKYFAFGYNSTGSTFDLSLGTDLQSATNLVRITEAGLVKINSLTASLPVFSDGSKGLVSNAMTGTGSVVMSASPTLTGTIAAASMTLSGSLSIGTTLGVTGALNVTGDFKVNTTMFVVTAASGNTSIAGTLTQTGVATFAAKPIMSTLTASLPVFSDGSKGLVSNAMTGTGNVVMSASPTLTGTIGAGALTLSSTLQVSGTSSFGSSITVSAKDSVFGSGSVSYGGTRTLVIAGVNAGAGTDGSALLIQPTTLSAMTSTSYGAEITMATAAASFTVSNLAGIMINDVTKGSGSTITTQYGLKIASQTQGATNYAINTGAGINLFGDGVNIGSASPTGTIVRIDTPITALTNTTQNGLVSLATFNSAATATMRAGYFRLFSAAASYTTTNGFGVYIDSASKGSGHTLTNLYGLFVNDVTAGGTNYAIKTGLGGNYFGDIVSCGTSAPQASQALKISNTALTGASQYQVVAQGTSTSSATASTVGLYSGPGTSANSYTCAAVMGVQIDDCSKGSGSTITTQYGLKIENQTQGATKYSIYTGSGRNFFGDTICINSTSPSGGGVKLSALNDDGVSSGEHFVAEFERSTGGSQLLIGYRANGSTDTGALIRSGNSLSMYLGTSSANQAVVIANSGLVTFTNGIASIATVSGSWVDSGTYTATTTGLTVNQTGTFRWIKIGRMVMLYCVNLTGLSNSTSFTITGMPSDIQPGRAQILYGSVNVRNNSNSYIGTVQIATSGVMSFGFFDTLTGGANFNFNSAGTGKGLDSTCTICYSLE